MKKKELETEKSSFTKFGVCGSEGLTWNPDLAFSGLAQGDWAAYRCSKLAGWAEQSIITHKSNSQKSSSLFELNKLQAG